MHIDAILNKQIHVINKPTIPILNKVVDLCVRLDVYSKKKRFQS